MFRLDDDFTEKDLSVIKQTIESNYKLKHNDYLLLDVFTNGGERLIDPNFEMGGGNVAMGQGAIKDKFRYLVRIDGKVNFPLIGDFQAEGKTIFEAEQELAKLYNKVYKQSYVKLRIDNRRVFVLGATGGKVIPLENENTNLLEILALSGGLQYGSKAHNIRVIRGKDEIFMVNLNTISGMKKTNMLVVPGDVIYVEPWRRPWVEALKDITPTLSLITSVLTLTILIQNQINK